MKAILGTLLIVIGLAGCTGDYSEIDRSHLDQTFTLHSSPTFRGYDYLGSDAEYHYFVAKWKYGRDQRFKVSESNIFVGNTRPRGQQGIQIFPHKPATYDTVEFGTIGQTTLYMEK